MKNSGHPKNLKKLQKGTDREPPPPDPRKRDQNENPSPEELLAKKKMHVHNYRQMNICLVPLPPFWPLWAPC